MCGLFINLPKGNYTNYKVMGMNEPVKLRNLEFLLLQGPFIGSRMGKAQGLSSYKPPWNSPTAACFKGAGSKDKQRKM